jgi:maltose alpha-D-glucosyltransferase/alpha-amylase
MLDARSIYQSIRSLAAQVLPLLYQRMEELSDDACDSAEAILDAQDRLFERLRALLTRPITARRIRCHGDLHLGQVLFTGGDFVIIDFEGEPARPLRERRLKRWALRDVAGMLRSFAYAGSTAGVAIGQEWARTASETFVDAYREAASGASFLPGTVEEQDLLLEVMLIEKALYELRYELDHRPEWVHIPMRGLADLLREA